MVFQWFMHPFFARLGFNNSFAGYFRKLCFLDQAYCAENSSLKLYHVLCGGWVLYHMWIIFYIKFAYLWNIALQYSSLHKCIIQRVFFVKSRTPNALCLLCIKSLGNWLTNAQHILYWRDFLVVSPQQLYISISLCVSYEFCLTNDPLNYGTFYTDQKEGNRTQQHFCIFAFCTLFRKLS